MHVKISRVTTKKGTIYNFWLAKVNNDSLSNRSNKISMNSNNQILFPAYIRIQYNIAWNGGGALSFILGPFPPLGSGVLSSELVHVER